MGTMFVTDTTTFYVARVLLGIAEAGFFPGMVLYLTYWIPAAERARTGALFMMAAPIAMIVGAPASEALLKLDGSLACTAGSGCSSSKASRPSCSAWLALWVLTDRPEHATWLANLSARGSLKRCDANGPRWTEITIAHSAKPGQRKRLASLGIYFLNTLVTYGIFLWLPRILRDASGLDGLALSAITTIPFVAALVGMVVIGRHSDRMGERKWHVAACALTAAAGLLVAVMFQSSLPLLVLGFTLSQLGQRSYKASSGPFLRCSWAERLPPPASRSSTRSGISAARWAIGHGLAAGGHVELHRRPPRTGRRAGARSGARDLAEATRTRHRAPVSPPAGRLDSHLPAPAVQAIVGRSYNRFLQFRHF